MLQRLYDFANKGGFFRRLLAALAILSIIGIGGVVGFFISFFICVGIESFTGSRALTELSIVLFMPLFTLGLPRLMLKGLPGKHKKEVAEPKQEEAAKDKEMPRLGELFGDDKAKELLRHETFHLHTFKNGKKAQYLKVSESGKWFSILGEAFPVDLICGYNNMSELYALDGSTIKLNLTVGSFTIRKELERFFRERGGYFVKMPQGARNEFREGYRKKSSALARDDWGTVRYQWEKRLLNNSYKYADRVVESDFHVLSPSGDLNTDIFERVLSDKELMKTVKAVRNNEVDIRKYLYFGDYKNEYSVCNAIELLKQLGYPQNLEGCDFLFDCLGNIDEPYFYMAVNLLKTYSRRMREEKIEEYAKAAHKSGDVEKFGGLLYLAKELKYDIKYVEKMKAEESQKDENAEEANEASPGQVMQMSK